MINRLVLDCDLENERAVAALSAAGALVAQRCYVTHHAPTGQYCVEYWNGAAFKLLLHGIDSRDRAQDLAEQMTDLGFLVGLSDVTLWDGLVMVTPS